MKNLVMGFGTNQSEHSLEVFCRSLRRIYTPDQCDLVIITNRYEDFFAGFAREGVHFMGTTSTYKPTTGKFAKAINRIVLNTMRGAMRVKLFEKKMPEIAASYPVLVETWHHPQIVRWLAYKRFLTLNRAYGQVFLADVKDVVFQGPIFSGEGADYVSFFEQDEIYGKCYWDTKWYREAWGQAALAKVTGKRSVCIGTVLGPHPAALSFVAEVCTFFELHPFGRIEQSVVNFLLLNDLVRTPYRVVDNIIGPVATLANDVAHNATVTRDGYIRRVVDGSIIPVVHMYDRWKDTNELYRGGMPFDAKEAVQA